MKYKIYLVTPLILILFFALGETKDTGEIKMLRQHSEIVQELRDVLRFMNIDYIIVDFAGNGLEGKSYHMTVSEIWDGEITNTSTVFNSADFPVPHLQRITDDTFQIRVVSELTDENKLRMHFNFPGLTIMREYDAIQSEFYSLRHATTQLETAITPGEKFFVLTYMLPYEENGRKHYCTVETSGSDILSWGEEFGIEHYLVFQMVFEE